ncbi:MAG TPA: serine/threonine-protein kinase [Bryobacteraceae bacterium]|nr:serine/threonine-protein kinase [Bryobacteraceae bacterium]
MEFQLGHTYAGYEFLDVIKRSRSGIEYRVRNTRSGRLEALRSLPESAEGDRERSERFLREVRVHASLLHPNIVTVFSALEMEHHLVMTTELVEGPTLADRLQLGRMPAAEAVAFIRQVLSALTYAHQQKVVHRDISPENIVVIPGGMLKLANFAFAKAPTSPKLTQAGFMVGNMTYISPEQIKGVGEVDARSDIYAAGMVLYEMLCGRPAFVCKSQFELMAAQVVQAPPPPIEVNPAIPPALSAVILKALAKDPAARYQSAQEFDQAIVQACESEPELSAVPVVFAGHASPSRSAEGAGQMVVARSAPEPGRGLWKALPDSLASVPAPVLSGGASPYLSNRQVTIGLAAGTCLGVLMVAIWLFAK